jgi:transmembrane sensor
MKNINKYQLEDFVQDLHFRKWVLGRLSEENHFWEDWLADHPEKKALVEEARSLVVATEIEEINIPESKVREGIDHILFQTAAAPARWYQLTWVRVAASVTVFLVMALILGRKEIKTAISDEKPVLSQSTETENNGKEPLSLKLSDGTVVTLKTGSKLQVAKDFGRQTRTVNLTGEAFFEVQKDPQHPFLVYAGGVVTKVLGTSFNVRAYHREASTSVAVRTGQVTVYQQEKADVKNNHHPEQILLTPNQKAVFEKERGKLVKTLVEKPVILSVIPENKNFDFNETPIPVVFTQLQQAYGVKIVFDSELLDKCNLTATFGNEPLYDKIDIICETIQARYEIADGQIVIYARGCK